MREMSIESIRLSLMNYQRVVILRERESDRFLPIWIGPAEAEAIAVRLQDVSVARPLTHDLLRNAIEQLGGKVSYIVVNDLANDTFFAAHSLPAGAGADTGSPVHRRSTRRPRWHRSPLSTAN